MDYRRKHLKLDPHHYIYSHYQFCIFPETQLSRVIKNEGILYCDDAVELNLYTTEHPTCPICLEEITLPRLTTCGHLYCWKCLMQFFVICPSPHKCPVCNALITNPFTICNIILQPKLQLGDEITMQLMKIPKGYIVPSPYLGETIHSPPSSKHANMKFHHVVIQNDPLSVIAREQLKISLLMKNPEEQEFIQYYMMMKDELVEIKKDWMKRNGKAPITINCDEWNFYYQDILGRHIYLLPFNLNMLLECPTKLSTITAKVLQIEEEDIGFSERKVHKSYQHIPFGTEIQIVEVDLMSDDDDDDE